PRVSSPPAPPTPTFTPTITPIPTVSATLTVIMTGNGSGSVISNPAAIDCSTNCSGQFPLHTAVVLAARPTIGSRFGTWGGACQPASGPTCTVTLDGNLSVSVTFIQTVQLTVSVTGNGRVTDAAGAIDCTSATPGPSCTATYDTGVLVALTATGANGSDLL